MEIIKATTSNGSRIEQMRQCPRFEKCNAPICPLDPGWQKCTMLAEDACCFYLQEAAKPGAQARFELHGHGELFEAISTLTPNIVAQHRIIYGRVERAKTYGSRMDKEPPQARKERD